MKNVPGYEFYQATESGEIYSAYRGGTHKKHALKKGYKVYGLMIGSRKIKWIGGHRLVAFAYIPNPENLPFVNHKDGDKQNNHKDNLEWVSRLGNAQHAAANGLYRTKGRHGRARVLLNTETGIYYDCVSEALDSIGRISPSHFWNMINGRKPNNTNFIYA